MGHFDWKTDLSNWLRKSHGISPILENSIVNFLELAFEHTRCRQRAWFGIHPTRASLVVGGIYLAAIQRSGNDQGAWLLVDQKPPQIGGIRYLPVKSSQKSKYPLMWMHSASLAEVPDLVADPLVWNSFASASEKILSSPISSDRDDVQKRRNKRLLSSFFGQKFTTLYPDELQDPNLFQEGARRTITVNVFERNEQAREHCIKHWGTTCCICGFLFGEHYGEIAEGFIHVHHLRELSDIGVEYTVNPVADLRPVCPNCHAVLHLRKPAFSIEEIQQIYRKRS
jgi:5-methylcytosine-specific restriction endonuclease McrA